MSRGELIETFGAGGAQRLLDQFDHDRDGKISIWELRRDARDGSDQGQQTAPGRDDVGDRDDTDDDGNGDQDDDNDGSEDDHSDDDDDG